MAVAAIPVSHCVLRGRDINWCPGYNARSRMARSEEDLPGYCWGACWSWTIDSAERYQCLGRHLQHPRGSVSLPSFSKSYTIYFVVDNIICTKDTALCRRHRRERWAVLPCVRLLHPCGSPAARSSATGIRGIRNPQPTATQILKLYPPVKTHS